MGRVLPSDADAVVLPGGPMSRWGPNELNAAANKTNYMADPNGPRLTGDEEDLLASQIAGFMARAPRYPGQGDVVRHRRGVVLQGGGRLAVPNAALAWMLRRTGCNLPIELWTFASETPAGPVLATLRRTAARAHVRGGHHVWL